MKSGRLARRAIALTFCAGPALAQTAPAPAPDAIVVTAARTQSLEVLGGLTIDRAAIEALQPVSALDALDRVAGVRAFGTAGIAGGSFIAVRGGKPSYTLTLIDGAKVNDPTNSSGGAFDFAELDPSLIERIEVYRGALSAVHGSDALSGVINVRLRAPAPGESGESARVTASTGSEIGGDASARLGWDGGGVLLGGGGYDSGELDRSGHLARRQGVGKLVGDVGPLKLSALGLYASADRLFYPESSGGPRLAINPVKETRSTQFGLASLQASLADPGPLVPTLSVDWSRQDVNDVTPRIAKGVLTAVPRVAARSLFERTEASFDLRYMRGMLGLAAGGYYLNELGRSLGLVDFSRFRLPANYRLRRETGAGYAEATLTPARWATLTASGRYDAPTTARARWTSRVAGRVTPVVGGPALFADYSDGFKLPSLYVLAYPLIANPALRPERARSAEVGIDWGFLFGARLRVSAFTSRYVDFIDFDPVRFKEVNRSRTDERGFDGDLTLPLGHHISATGSFAYLKSADFSGPPLRNRPDWTGAARVTWTPSTGTYLFADFNSVSSDYDLSVPTGQITMRGHSEVGVGGGFAVMKGLALDLTLRNLADSRYEDAVGFPNPGRVLRATLRFSR